MRVGFFQYEPMHLKPQDTREYLESQLLEADTDILVLPELALSGYRYASREELHGYAEPAEGATCRWFQDLSRKTGTLYVYGYPERSSSRVYNSAAAVDSQGLLSNYRKLHLYNTEKLVFTPGNRKLIPCTWKGVKLGLLVCFDHLFPEAARSLALQGAQVICHPSNLVIREYAQLTSRVRAIENRVFWILANRIGAEGTITFTGRSQLVDETGTVLASAGNDQTSLQTADIDPQKAVSKAISQENDLFGDRVPRFYSKG